MQPVAVFEFGILLDGWREILLFEFAQGIKLRLRFFSSRFDHMGNILEIKRVNNIANMRNLEGSIIPQSMNQVE